MAGPQQKPSSRTPHEPKQTLADIYKKLQVLRHHDTAPAPVMDDGRDAATTGLLLEPPLQIRTGPGKRANVSRRIDELERERKRLENRDFAQNTELKRRTLRLLFRFLAVETGLIFAFAFAQATRWPLDFHMEEWSFKLLVAGTIAQITGMLFVAVRYLFPGNPTKD